VCVDDAAVLLDDTTHTSHTLTHERLDLVRRQLLADARRSDDVREEGRHGPQLVLLCATEKIWRGLAHRFGKLAFPGRNRGFGLGGLSRGGGGGTARARSHAAGVDRNDPEVRAAELDDVIR